VQQFLRSLLDRYSSVAGDAERAGRVNQVSIVEAILEKLLLLEIQISLADAAQELSIFTREVLLKI
jgi:hypothetical protein